MKVFSQCQATLPQGTLCPLYFLCSLCAPCLIPFMVLSNRRQHTLHWQLGWDNLCCALSLLCHFFCVPAPCCSSFLLAMLYPPQHYTCEYFSYISILGCTGSSKHRKMRLLLYGLCERHVCYDFASYCEHVHQVMTTRLNRGICQPDVNSWDQN